MDTTYTTDKAKFHGFQLGIEIAAALVQRGEVVDLNQAMRLVGSIADGLETLVDPEQSYEGWDPATAKVLREGKINAIEHERRHASEVRCGLNAIVDGAKRV